MSPRLLDLEGNEMTWDEAHRRVEAWYEREAERRQPVLELRALRRSEAQRARRRRATWRRAS